MWAKWEPGSQDEARALRSGGTNKLHWESPHRAQERRGPPLIVIKGLLVKNGDKSPDKGTGPAKGESPGFNTPLSTSPFLARFGCTHITWENC